MELKLTERDLFLVGSSVVESIAKAQAKVTLQQVIDEIDYCRTLDELKQKLSEALK